jgi:CO/xanthine dehydrogenase Mo-binding subunit
VLIGKPLKRLDTPNKANGKAVYGIDAILPGMKFATVAACPVFGGKVGKVDDSAAKKIPGVQKIVVLDDMVAVVGDHMWAAKKGLDALVIDWNEGRLQVMKAWRRVLLRRSQRPKLSWERFNAILKVFPIPIGHVRDWCHQMV